MPTPNREVQKKTVSQIAFEEHVQKRTVEEGMERLATTGSVLPAKPGVKKGTILQKRRKTTTLCQNKVRPTILKKRKRKSEYTTYQLQQDVGGSFKKVHRTTVGKRIREEGFRAKKPRRKENYTKKQREDRVDWGEMYEKWTEEDWRRMVFIDEHAMTVPSAKTGSRQLHSRKRFVWREKGDNPFDNDLVAPKGGKNVMGGTPVRAIFAILDDEFIIAENTTTYVGRTKLAPKKAPKKSKNGKRLGRPPEKKTQKQIAKRRYDSSAHALFLRDMHAAALKKLGGEVEHLEVYHLNVYQDGLPLHRAPSSRAVMNELKMVDHRPPKCGYSPDTNCIEELFSTMDDRQHKAQMKKRCMNPQEWMTRTKRLCTEMGPEPGGDGTVGRTVAAMPKHVKDLLAAKGGPTRW